LINTIECLHQQKEETIVKRKLSTGFLLAAVLLLVLAATAIALTSSKVADVFGWFYGDSKKDELLEGDIAPSGQSVTLGDVTYTLDEVIYSNNMLYGTGTISAAQGKEAVLLAEDYFVNDTAGYILHYGKENIPLGAPTYAQLASQKGCKILLAKCVANGLVENGELNASEIGYTQLPQPDGTIRFTFEFAGGAVDDNNRLVEKDIGRAAAYTLSLHISNWEVTQDGEWLREEPNNTWLKEDWLVTVTPTVKEK
jgi:hypothetical protein